MRFRVAAGARVKKYPTSQLPQQDNGRNQKLYEMENIDIWEHYDDLNRFLNAYNVLAASARLFLYKSICIEQYGFTVNPLFLLKHSETIFSLSLSDDMRFSKPLGFIRLNRMK